MELTVRKKQTDEMRKAFEDGSRENQVKIKIEKEIEKIENKKVQAADRERELLYQNREL